MRATILLAVALASAHAQAAELALKRVMLSSAGVGYFEYAAEVEGPVTLGLDVPLAQVDDVLKSLVVFDDAGGIGGIELPGRDATHSAFGDVPFGPEGFASPLAFLNSLQGVAVVVAGPRPMSGRILQAEQVREPASPETPGAAPPLRTRVSVLTEDGLKQFVLEDSEAVQIADPSLRARVDRALAAARRESGQDSRHITLRSTGTAHRTIRVGYVAVAPLWKASYRLVLPAGDAADAKARLQGWATLENASGTDWSGVSLSLQYGNPVTFHQAIYKSYFVTRPEVPVEVLGRLLPDVDTRATGSAEASAPAPMPAPMQMPPPPAAAMQAPAPRAQRFAFGNAIAKPAEAAAADEGAQETVFALPTPLTLAAGHSASVPIIDREVPAARLSIARAGEANPLAAVRLRNESNTSLPAGVLTLYDARGEAPYAGDARLGGLPIGETRLLSFAADLRTSLVWHDSDEQHLASLTAASGMVRTETRDRRIWKVTISAPAREARHILLELPKQVDAAVATGFLPAREETAQAWRFAFDVGAGEKKDATLATDHAVFSSASLIDDAATLAAILDMEGMSDAARAALTHVAELREQEAARTAERDQLTSQRQSIERDEERLRANLGAVQAGDALHGRLARQLDADETRLATLAVSIEAAERATARAHQALADAVANLKL